MIVTIKYAKPCFAECANFVKCGKIILMTGKSTEIIFSKKAGSQILEDLVDSGEISTEDYGRIMDQLGSSELENTDKNFLVELGKNFEEIDSNIIKDKIAEECEYCSVSLPSVARN